MSDVYAAMESIAQSTSLPTLTICDVLEVSRSAYYDWFTREPGVRERELDYSRDIVAWSIDATMAESLVPGVLRRAIRERQPKAGLTHHTDRGGQYAGREYRAVLRRASMKQSMSCADNCYDNAFMESCWSSIKRELEVAEYESVAAARKIVAEYVRYDRFERKHSALGHLTPNQFATRTMTQN